jgi:hypothetical protein
MKYKMLILLGLLFVTTLSWSQQIDVSGLYSSSTAKAYKNNWGFDFGYYYFVRNNRLGISFRQIYFNTEYDDIYTSSNDDGVSKYIKEYAPKHKRSTINLDYSYKLIENEKSNVYLGCSAGLNYFKLKGEYNRIENGNISGGQFYYDYSVNNRFGFGLLLEYEVVGIFSDRVSSSIKINPEITAFDEWATFGGYDPWMIGWLNFSIGLKYQLKK